MSSSRHPMYRIGGVIVTLGLCLLLPAWAQAGQAGQPPSPGKGQQAAPAAADYAGDDTCLTCHQDMAQGYHGSAHGRAWDPRSPAATTHGCESCHGPGKAHAEAGGDRTKIRSFKTMPAAEQNAACASCHNRGPHALWPGSQHDQRNLTCSTCHSVHAPKGPSQLKTGSEMALCATCHRAQTNRQFRFSHMPVREGKMSCSSCHNVHGTQNIRLLSVGATVQESCTKCHADKRGPFLWEHAPVVESCVTCHEPHGSNNERMLIAKQPFICQRCHVTSRHPPTVYEGYQLQNSTNANKMYSRACLNCHQMVHGSNAPSGKAFLR